MPLYCFVVLVMRSDSPRCRTGGIVRPIPEEMLGDEKGHFWKKKNRIPEVGDIVEITFYDEDNRNYLSLGS